MTIIACADIDTNGTTHYVYNVMDVLDTDFDFLASLWSGFFPGRYMVPVWDLEPATGYVKPVWIGWIQGEDGTWSDPTRPPIEPPIEQETP